MNNFEKELVEAMITSPYAFEAFKKRQYNYRHFDQVLKKIWPYTDIKKDLMKLIKIRRFLKKVIWILESAKVGTYWVRSPKSNILTKIFSNYGGVPYINNIEIRVGKLCYGSYFYFNDTLNSCTYFKIVKQTNKKIHVKIFHDTMNHIETRIKNYKAIRNRMNVGIEIEFDAKNSTPYYVIKKIMETCVSFDSGFDGNNKERLRENRIRLGGPTSLKGLWELLRYMQKRNKLAKNSSVHIHIDAAYDDSFMKRKGKYTSPEIRKQFKQLPDCFLSEKDMCICLKPEHQTVELRSCYPTFNYSLIVLQVLAAAHIINKEIDYEKIDKEYLAYIESKMRELTKEISCVGSELN